ncbi:MAG: DnaJ domain-containing protein [Myxococcota bacterium]|nr:DnaJ domain-containing protein [Myxococcota bacterium]
MALEFERRVEVETLHGVLEELDYYRLLKLRSGAPIPQVEKAFAEQSQVFHPDRVFGVRDPQFMKKVTAIFKKVNEGYQVLRDPDLKKMYDQKLGVRKNDADNPVHSAGKHAHVSKATLEQEKAALAADEVVSDKRARKYWDLAQIAESNQDWNGVVMNIQFALNYDPDNVLLKQKVADAKIKMRTKNKKNKNPYKIKIV